MCQNKEQTFYYQVELVKSFSYLENTLNISGGNRRDGVVVRASASQSVD